MGIYLAGKENSISTSTIIHNTNNMSINNSNINGNINNNINNNDKKSSCADNIKIFFNKIILFFICV